MPKPALCMALLAAALIACPAPGDAATAVVHTGPGAVFNPPSIAIQAGDSVQFINDNVTGGFHNVAADDGSFRCANGCDDTGGDGSPATNWSFTRLFPAAGTVGYHCQIHGAPGRGMAGTIVVTAPPPLTSIPTLDSWRLLTAALLLGGAGLAVLRRRRRHRSGGA